MTTDQTGESANEPTFVQPLRQAFAGITGLDIDRDLVRSTQLGDASFAESRALFREIIEFAKSLEILPWGRLTPAMVNNVATPAAAVVSSLKQIQDFNLQQGDPIASRNALAQQVTNSFYTFKEATLPAVGFLSWQSVNLGAIRGEVESVLADAKTQVAETLQQLAERKSEADATLEAMRVVSASAGVSHHAEVFAATAREHRATATRWLWFTGGSAVLTIVAALAVVLLWKVEGDISNASVFQLVVVKGVLLAVGFYATFNCMRMYRAFAEGTDNAEVKDKVLLEATHAIFAPASTGLIDGKDTSDTLEVLDGVTGLLRRH